MRHDQHQRTRDDTFSWIPLDRVWAARPVDELASLRSSIVNCGSPNIYRAKLNKQAQQKFKKRITFNLNFTYSITTRPPCSRWRVISTICTTVSNRGALESKATILGPRPYILYLVKIISGSHLLTFFLWNDNTSTRVNLTLQRSM